MPLISLVLEHADFVVINKPVGIPMHDPVLGICQQLKLQFKGQAFYLVHRLDTDTSGCLLLANNAKAAADLSALFSQRLINKTYLALSDKKPKKKQGKIVGDMQKTRQGNYKLTQSTHNPAITFLQSEVLDSMRLFYLKPITGKTHQLRVALNTLGSPIIGDKRYKGTASDRLYLHSYALEFRYQEHDFSVTCLPETGELFSAILTQGIKPPDELTWPKYKHPKQLASFSASKIK